MSKPLQTKLILAATVLGMTGAWLAINILIARLW